MNFKKNVNLICQKTKLIRFQFIRQIGECSIRSLEVELLPLYTLVAMSHVVFLEFLRYNHDNSKIHINPDTFKHQVQPDIDGALTAYRTHVQITYATKNTQIQNNMIDIFSHHGYTLYHYHVTPDQDQKNLNLLKDRKKQLEAEFNVQMRNSNGYPVYPSEELKRIPGDIKNFEELIAERQTYYERTLGNPGFRILVPFNGWHIKDGKWYYYDNDGHIVTGWKVDDNKHVYYLDPKNNGVIVTGWKNFTLRELIQIPRFNFSAISPSVVKIVKHTNFKGDLHEIKIWFYFNKPKGEQGHIEGFAEGESIYNGTYKIGKIDYIFDHLGICQNP
ncbi:hypothetical protein [Bacillus thuringiensis]|uniref:hypothetical protein n=1 Tax=Bacillus cereus group TaxID=86661 RepID=UPI00034CE7C5|nr:hypothetical protein [Bacillus thuringiensis]MCH5449892.1 hypothetical protein [Bacillus cereus]MCU5187769.1 hypothetical protein [Bacillus cereus]